tara:strand:- start:1583 stop:1990 length:408 start_codon:yes stop_codon:yes gene_type:complete
MTFKTFKKYFGKKRVVKPIVFCDSFDKKKHMNLKRKKLPDEELTVKRGYEPYLCDDIHEVPKTLDWMLKDDKIKAQILDNQMDNYWAEEREEKPSIYTPLNLVMFSSVISSYSVASAVFLFHMTIYCLDVLGFVE